MSIVNRALFNQGFCLGYCDLCEEPSHVYWHGFDTAKTDGGIELCAECAVRVCANLIGDAIHATGVETDPVVQFVLSRIYYVTEFHRAMEERGRGAETAFPSPRMPPDLEGKLRDRRPPIRPKTKGRR
jgi:hypothetical protein